VEISQPFSFKETAEQHVLNHTLINLHG